MSGESRVLPIVAVVVGVVACLPSACCLAFYALANLVPLPPDPRVIEAMGSGPVPSQSTFVVRGALSTIGALVALGLAIAGLVWGIRGLRRQSS